MDASKRIDVPCNTTAGREAARKMREFLSEHAISEDLLFACELSLTEACNNAVHHFGPPEPKPNRVFNQNGGPDAPPISVEARVTDSHVELEVTDHTTGFEWPGKVPQPDPEITTGRGLFLIQSMMDECGYRRGQGENVLWMRKKR